MYIVGTVLIVFITLYCLYKIWEWAENSFYLFLEVFIMLVLVFATALGLLVIVLSICYQVNHQRVGEITESKEIVALSNATETGGRFYLGSGLIEGNQYYYYFTPEKNGYRMGKTKSSEAILMEGESENYRIDTVIADEFGFKDHYIYIPPESILFNFDISLPNQ